MGGILTIRKLADKTAGERLVRYDPETGAKKLVNPATEGDDHEPWPLAGIQLDDPPAVTTISTSKVEEGMVERWISLVGERLEHRPGGPAEQPWRSTHTFRHADEVVFHTVDGDVRYRVVHQPDKYADPGDDTTPVTSDVYAAGVTRVDWFYGLERADA